MENLKVSLFDLHEAVSKQICRPKDSERRHITVDRQLQASPAMEGDSQIGLILFVGLAGELGLDPREAMEFVGIESKSEYNYKVSKYKTLSKAGGRFAVKKRLILNYLKYKCMK